MLSRLHAPVGTAALGSQRVCGGPPEISTRLSRNGGGTTVKARERLSGDQKRTPAAFSVPGKARASSVSSIRTQIWPLAPPSVFAIKASIRPSGEIAGGAVNAKFIFSGGGTWKRTSSGTG